MLSVLKENNLKNTKNREHILSTIKKSKLPISAEEIYKILIDKKLNVNLSTIYRTLNTLEVKGVLIKQIRNDGKSYFQENKHDHKHLFVCTSCGKTIVLDHCPLKEMLEKISKTNAFEITSHNIELYGLCKDCKEK